MGFLRNHEVQFEPFESPAAWPGQLKSGQMSSQFRSDLTQTLTLLDNELWHLKAAEVVLQTFHGRGNIRIDGMPRAGVSPTHPGVVLRFQSKGRPFAFPCQTYASWTENLRAIAKSLEALRTVDRYGVTTSDEQYRGWLALPAPTPTIEQQIPDVHEATLYLAKLVSAFAARQINVEDALVRAERLTHPDKGGDPDDFKRVQRCRQLLGARR